MHSIALGKPGLSPGLSTVMTLTFAANEIVAQLQMKYSNDSNSSTVTFNALIPLITY